MGQQISHTTPPLEDVERAYATTDFEFVAFALAYGRPKVHIVDTLPDRSSRGERQRFIFLLMGDDAENANWFDELKELSMQFVSGQTLIEPVLLASKRKFLRGLILGDKRIKNRGYRSNGSKKRQKGTPTDE